LDIVPVGDWRFAIGAQARISSFCFALQGGRKTMNMLFLLLWDKGRGNGPGDCLGEAFSKNIGGRPLGVALSQSKGPDRHTADNLFLHWEHFLSLERRPGWGEFKAGFIFHILFSVFSARSAVKQNAFVR
jgi:hypothetical protein